jgi:uncharacterized protein with PQ loop repeat
MFSHVIGFDNHTYIEALGFLSAGIEACLGLPQIVANFKNKNTDTVSFFMLITWAFGDSFKTLYFFKTLAPLQLLLCGLFQITMDLVLLGQLIYYSYNFPKIEGEHLKKGDDIDNMLDFGDDSELDIRVEKV